MRILLAPLRFAGIVLAWRAPILLTEWLDLPDTVKCRVFGWAGVHDNLADWCPGWCPCGADLAGELAELAELDPEHLAAAVPA